MGLGLSMPHYGSFRARARLALVVCAVVMSLCVARPRAAFGIWPFDGDPAKETVGSAQWWKKNQKNKVFVEGKGYQIEGVDGYFDGFGHPIAAPVTPDEVLDGTDDKDDVGLIPGLDPKIGYDKMKAAVGLGPNEQFARKCYVEGDRLFREGKYKQAAEEFSAAVTRGPHSSIEQDAMFMLAESYYFDDRYIPARDAYDTLVKEYSNTRYLDKVIEHEWNIAQYWEKLDRNNRDWPLTPNVYDKKRPWFDTIGHAIKTYESIRLNDPTGPKADDAIMATANIYFERARYDDADYHYKLLRTQYPRSELQYEAHLLGLQALLRKYQGENYDGTPLEDAKLLVKQLNSQFASRLPKEEKERLATVEAQLNQEVANRDYRMAVFHDYKDEYAAAKHYYAEVIKKYPDTELATKSRERYAALKDQPDDAPSRIAFLLDRLPQSRERARVARIPELQNGGTRLAQTPNTSSDSSSTPTTTK